MYRKAEQAPSPAEEFELSNGCKLAVDNRWVQLGRVFKLYWLRLGVGEIPLRLSFDKLNCRAQVEA